MLNYSNFKFKVEICSNFHFFCGKMQEDTAIKELLINEQIRDAQVRLVGENGEQLGIVSLSQALKEEIPDESAEKISQA